MGQIQIIKEDEATNKRLAEAKFQITDESGAVVDVITTDESGEALTKKLPYGKYTINEIKAPKNYQKINQVKNVYITKNNQILTVSVTDQKFNVHKEPKASKYTPEKLPNTGKIDENK